MTNFEPRAGCRLKSNAGILEAMCVGVDTTLTDGGNEFLCMNHEERIKEKLMSWKNGSGTTERMNSKSVRVIWVRQNQEGQ